MPELTTERDYIVRRRPPEGDNNRVLRVFVDVSMAFQHDGLLSAATYADKAFDPARCRPGEHLVFINRYQNRMKVLTATGEQDPSAPGGQRFLLSYLRVYEGRIDLNMIMEIPRAYRQNVGIMFDHALNEALRERFEKKQRRKVGRLAVALDLINQAKK